MTPDEYHQRCPFLFWTIVYVGCRYYTKDPTLLGVLAPKLNAMAFLALESRSYPLLTIQGLLLLAMWPVPMNTMYRDVSLVLSGAALHFSRQVGLHIFGIGQDFARTTINADTLEAARRAALWRVCCEVYYGYVCAANECQVEQ